MFKIIMLLMSLCVYADRFQQFDNQFSVTYGLTSGSLINGKHSLEYFKGQSAGLLAERIFNSGVWLRTHAEFFINYDQPNLGSLNGGNSSGVPFGQYQFLSLVDLKVGYAITAVQDYLQVIPYALIGRSASWATSTVLSNGGNNITSDYYITGALGGRIEYAINNIAMLYADQSAVYNWDNSGAIKHIQSSDAVYGKSFAATDYAFRTEIGMKFNISYLQLGISALYNRIQPHSNIAGVMYTPYDVFSGILSFGMIY